MTRPRVLVLSGYGLNCEAETQFAFERAGAQVVDIVHINDLVAEPKRLAQYQIMALPGGFSFGDDTGSGNAYAARLKHHLEDPLRQFVAADKLVVGICNGFQIISNLGLVPAVDKAYGKRSVALTSNDGARYIDRWVDVKVEGNSPWVAGMGTLAMPIAHGEGKLFAEPAVLRELKTKRLVALRYVRGEMCDFQDLPANPNGSAEDIAGITDESGRILGLMPHPERAMFFTQLPNWPGVKESLRRQGQSVPEDGPGLRLFENAVHYFE
jgi:phosphoribosylformylglycinamidine synthase I